MTNNKLFFEIWYGDLVYQTKISYGGVVPSYTKDDNNNIENIVEKGYFAANCTVSSKEEKPYLHILGKKRKKKRDNITPALEWGQSFYHRWWKKLLALKKDYCNQQLILPWDLAIDHKAAAHESMRQHSIFP